MQSKICALLIFSALFCGAFVRAEEASYLKFDETVAPGFKHKWDGKWRGKMGGTSVSEGMNEGAAAAFEFDAKFDFTLAEWARVHVAPELTLFSSRVQERFDDDEYQNRIRLNSAYLELQPSRFVLGRAGAIDQDFLQLDILVSKHRTFPGLQEVFSTDRKPLNLKFVAQQLVPTSYSMNTDREDKEPLPTFQTQSLHLDAEYPVSLGLVAGHYNWNNLPDKVAAQSFIAGNTPDNGETVAGSKFRYAFDGFFWSGGVCLCELRPVKVDVLYQGEHNVRAPAEKADAQLWAIRPTWIMKDSRELSVAYINYFIEPDATVALYTRSLLGYANRMGDLFEVKYDLKDLGWAIKAQYANARTVADSSNQQTYSEFTLWVETAYAPF